MAGRNFKNIRVCLVLRRWYYSWYSYVIHSIRNLITQKKKCLRMEDMHFIFIVEFQSTRDFKTNIFHNRLPPSFNSVPKRCLTLCIRIISWWDFVTAWDLVWKFNQNDKCVGWRVRKRSKDVKIDIKKWQTSIALR